jgi:uncharacterized membrane protein
LSEIIFGLLSAITWGGGDFAGGVASRRVGAFKAVFYGESIGLVFLFAAIPLVNETIPAIGGLLSAALAGTIGSLGLLILYQAIANGKMSIAMPVSALLAAVLPVVVSAISEGLPGRLQMIGFGLALIAIWLISQDAHDNRLVLEKLSDLRLPLFAGLCFGTYFVLIHNSTQQATLWPMIASRSGGTLLMLVVLFVRKEPFRAPLNAFPLISINAIMDVGGNLFYILAGQTGRLDVAAVLSSLYPGVTVILAWLLLKEHISSGQRVGILFALIAIGLMTV